MKNEKEQLLAHENRLKIYLNATVKPVSELSINSYVGSALKNEPSNFLTESAKFIVTDFSEGIATIEATDTYLGNCIERKVKTNIKVDYNNKIITADTSIKSLKYDYEDPAFDTKIDYDVIELAKTTISLHSESNDDKLLASTAYQINSELVDVERGGIIPKDSIQYKTDSYAVCNNFDFFDFNTDILKAESKNNQIVNRQKTKKI